jgi:triosephosphate isomerase
MQTPVIVVNFKVYEQVVGEKGLNLAKTCELVANETGKSIVIAPQQVDLALISKEVNIPVFSQHIDPVKVGSNTGHTTVEGVVATGAKGTLINHSENRLKIAEIDWLVQKCHESGLETIVCTNNFDVSKACALLNPDYIAIEPPELIGGDISVTSADPGIIKTTATALKQLSPDVGVLCGAGVKTGDDVTKAIELGTDGVLLASGVTKASDPKQALMDLVNGL